MGPVRLGNSNANLPRNFPVKRGERARLSCVKSSIKPETFCALSRVPLPIQPAAYDFPLETAGPV